MTAALAAVYHCQSLAEVDDVPGSDNAGHDDVYRTNTNAIKLSNC
jgi:hypothetical protein